MPIFKKNNDFVFFSHIPKTGGMSIETSFLKTHEVFLKTPKLHGIKQEKLPCSPQHFHYKIIKEMFGGKPFTYQFCVVRHPLDRLISEYNFLASIAVNQKKVLPGFEEWFELTIEKYRKDSFVMDNHIRPQVEFVCDEMDIFKYEDGLSSIIPVLADNIPTLPFFKDFQFINKSKVSGITCESIGERVKFAVEEFYKDDYDYFCY